MHDTFPSEQTPSIVVYPQRIMLDKIRAAKLPLTPSQRRLILSADYSIAIKIEFSNRARSQIDEGFIAAVLTRSIKGLYPKLRNFVRKSNVIKLTAAKYHGIAKAQTQLDTRNREDGTLAEAYYELDLSKQQKNIDPREADTKREIYRMLFERSSSHVGKVTVRFLYPEEWFDPKGEKEVFKDGTGSKCEMLVDIGYVLDPGKDLVAKKAYELAIKKFETAVFAGWDPDLSRPKTIDSNIDFTAKYRRKQKSSEQSDIENAGDNFDYYVVPMPGLKYPDEDDEI